MRYQHLLVAALLLIPQTAKADPQSGYYDGPDNRQNSDRRDVPARRSVRIEGLAHEMETASIHAYRVTAGSQRYWSWRERRALGKVNRLADAARRFHDQVESSRQNPPRTDADFRSLVRAHAMARSAIDRDLNVTRSVRDAFTRVDAVMNQLSRFYERGEYPGMADEGSGYRR